MAAEAPYKSPKPPLGPILWSPRPGSPFFAAIVTKTDLDAVSLIVFPEDSRGGSPRTSVLHVGNPRFFRLEDQSQGVWDFTDDQKKLELLSKADRTSK